MAAAREIRARETNQPGDDDAVELAKRHLVQPWPYAGSVGAEARALIGEGDGIYITDASGKRLIDGPAGMWCLNVGHRREELASVMYNQAMALSYNTPWYTMNAPSAELARRISGHAPADLSHTFFTTGGSSAVETALRFMQFYNNVRGRPEKKLILSRGGAYHGSTYLSASLNGRPRDRDWMDGADELVVKLSSPDPFRRPKEMSIAAFTDFLVDQFRDTVARVGADRIGAFVGEPVQASGGVVVPPEGYLRRVRQICRDNDILYVSDEVVTGFGRLGHVFASGEVFGIDPDMITFAKGVTSGYFPLGGVIISGRLLEQLRRSNHPDALFGHGLTYTSHPIGCAVALKNLDLLEDGVLAHAREVAPYFQARLKSLEELPLVGEVRGMGLMACIECVADRESRNPLQLDKDVGKRIDAHCHELGLLVRPLINMCVMSPPLIISREQIDDMVAILREGISRTMDDLRKEGVWRG
ncbi:MAG: aminotransferase [Mesorhizobium sp.]|uniref:aminotransferase n=4 Tax=Mesorhizobium TaxID=68287 RepID=UPI000FD397FF|nr:MULTISPECIES: aminotransferase [unclassified Mesorhizobium]RVD41860.1 aminotransferase [Mesorhizobium sp. M4A.F.Ca.ET.020.02.1.1]RWC21523.1 MAG: aminotransferase [Mesorhizobium sp.]RWC57578.1 MAG: aminotransferase [Mesorhizobium sp.]RWD05903.1 MAG: aminotransferase [Mesorhizobium sp.]RWD17687.1 MAG: aminotransferase [Mesorhizobium sp.]